MMEYFYTTVILEVKKWIIYLLTTSTLLVPEKAFTERYITIKYIIIVFLMQHILNSDMSNK